MSQLQLYRLFGIHGYSVNKSRSRIKYSTLCRAAATSDLLLALQEQERDSSREQ